MIGHCVRRTLYDRCVVLVVLFVSVCSAQTTRPASPPGSMPASGPTVFKVPEATSEAKRLVDRSDLRVAVLKNGLTVILKAHRTAAVVSVRMYCKTGSIYEQEYLGSGMSHLFEHLLHGAATARRSEEESRKILNEIGGNTNAYTSYESTCYFINTGREHLAVALQLLSDWITRPTFPQEAFDREWAVVQRELERDTDDPEHQLHCLTMETMYREHPARYPIIGHQPIVQMLKKEDIVGYYHRMYVPDNIVVCIAGDVNLDEAQALVQQEFASFQRKRLPNVILPVEPPMTSPRTASKRMKVQAATMRMAWPTIPLVHTDLYALDVLSFILSQGDSSRLARAVRDRGLAFTVDSSSWTPNWGRGFFDIVVRFDSKKLEDVRTAINEQVEQIKRDLVTSEELNQAKRQKMAEHVFNSQTADEIASMIASDYLATGDVDFSAGYVANIQKVTPEEIREVARKYLSPQRLATIMVVPEDFPTAPQDSALTVNPEPIRKVVLSNGVRGLIRRDPTTPLVAIQAYSLGGVLFEDTKTNGLSQLASLLAPRGTAKRSAQEIARFFDLRGGTLDGGSGSNTLYFSAQILKQDFAEAFEVFADVVCHPSFPATELGIYRPQLLDQIARLSENWRPELLAYFDSRMFKNSPYQLHILGSAQVVAKATREEIAAFHRDHIIGPNTVVAIFGDVDVAQAEKLLATHFGTLPSTPLPIPVVAPEPPIEQPSLYIKAKPATRDVAGIAVGFPGMKITDIDDTVRMAVVDTIISGYRYPTGWLHDSLRGGDRGLVYEVHAMNRPGLLPGVFEIYAACQPQAVTEVYRIIKEQVERARKGEFTADELNRAKSIIRTTELIERQTNSARAMQSALDELYGLGFDYRDKYVDQVDRSTLDDIKMVAQKYFSSAPVITVTTPAPGWVRIGPQPLAVDHDSLGPEAIVPDGKSNP